VNLLSQVRSYWRVLPSARRNRLDLLVWLRHRPQILAATGVYETALVASARMDLRLKQLAELKTAALVNCEYCLDIGSALCLATGISETQLRDLPNFRTSEAFSGDEKMVLEFAEAMTQQPALISDDLRQRMLDRFSPTQVTELAATIAWENYRGRLNQALGVRPSGFSEGSARALPEK
jgi:AhpD family alkylhydroperoxidase